MTKKTRAIINKINFLIKMEFWNDLKKMEEYLQHKFSCAHCKYYNIPGRRCSLNNFEKKKDNYIVEINGFHWCLGWTKPHNWVNRKKKVE